jgi:hypothetical protein
LCSGKAPDSYSGYVWFEYRPEHRVSWLTVFLFILSPRK